MNTSFLSVTTASTLDFLYLVIKIVISGAIVGVVICSPLTSGQRPLIQVMPESPLTSMDIGRKAADWWVLDWDKLWLKEFLWRTIYCCTFSKSVNQLDSQPFTQSRGQSVDRWRVSQSVGLLVSWPMIAECFYLLLSKYLFVAAFKRKMMIRFRTYQCWKIHFFRPFIAVFSWSLKKKDIIIHTGFRRISPPVIQALLLECGLFSFNRKIFP